MTDLKDIKQQFFTYRNGLLAEQLRNSGNPCGVIFGLNIPQIAAIARELEPSMELADALWSDENVRESRILATYLFPREKVTAQKAAELMQQVRTPEEADMLAFRLLKHMSFASALAEGDADTDIGRYAKTALCRHLE